MPRRSNRPVTTMTTGKKIIANLKCGMIIRPGASSSSSSSSSSLVVDLEKVIKQIEDEEWSRRPFLSQTSSPLDDVTTAIDFYYDKDDIKRMRGKQRLEDYSGGRFYEWYKIKRLPDHHQEGEATESSNTSNNNDNSLHHHQQQYSVKQLHCKNFSSKAQQPLVHEAVLRLILEAQYLSRLLSHPNIMSLKGLPKRKVEKEDNIISDGTTNEIMVTPAVAATTDDFFIIAPKMIETLESRLNRWRQYQDGNYHKADVESFDSNNATYQSKLCYARDIASALTYLHKKRIILVNLNPKSIGFLEPSGILQITDLSCCQEDHHRHHEDQQEGDEATASSSMATRDEAEMAARLFGTFTDTTTGDNNSNNTVTNNKNDNNTNNYLLQIAANGDRVPRYIAPEVLLHQYYTTKADTYSFSLILFELLTLSQPYTTLKTGPQHLQKVCLQGQRPHLSIYTSRGLANKELQSLICHTWNPSVTKRPPMSKVLSIISKHLLVVPPPPPRHHHHHHHQHHHHQQQEAKKMVVANPQA